ncbi:MAG: radical SAM protein [Clostridia bacterium]|nr:radical SAM protein [Clostridia bacterium]
MTKVGLISLGCDKNRVDSERILFNLANNGYELTEDVSNADVVIVNTCAFIGDAKKESIDNILEMAELKKTSLKKLLVTGCFATRYGQDVQEDLPEVDAFVDIKDEEKIIEILNSWFNYDTHIDRKCGRIITTPMHYAYLKIADGCNNRCSYCAIPFIRGKYVSTPIEELVEEATTLYKEGVKELILVAQDTTNYGVDIYGKRSLVMLLKELTKIDFWKIRLLYCYPELID